MTNQSVKWLTIREIYSSAATLMELFYCSQVEYLTIIVICFFCGDLSVASVTLIGIRYTETVSELQQQHSSHYGRWYRRVPQFTGRARHLSEIRVEEVDNSQLFIVDVLRCRGDLALHRVLKRLEQRWQRRLHAAIHHHRLHQLNMSTTRIYRRR